MKPLVATMIDGFKEISIRSRLAYGATCLENALDYYAIKDELLRKVVLPRIWEFTSSKDLSAWDESINKIDPVVLLDDNAHGPLSEQDASLVRLYNSLPAFITEMISDVIEIGAGNLYGGTGQYSDHSLIPLEKVIESCKTHNVTLPDLTSFKKSRYEEEHGWGKERERQFYLQ